MASHQEALAVVDAEGTARTQGLMRKETLEKFAARSTGSSQAMLAARDFSRCMGENCPVDGVKGSGTMCAMSSCLASLSTCMLHSECFSSVTCQRDCMERLKETDGLPLLVAVTKCFKDTCPNEIPPGVGVECMTQCGGPGMACEANSHCAAAAGCLRQCSPAEPKEEATTAVHQENAATVASQEAATVLQQQSTATVDRQEAAAVVPTDAAAVVVHQESAATAVLSEEQSEEEDEQSEEMPFYNVVILILCRSRDRDATDAIRNSYGKDLDSSGYCASCPEQGTRRTVKYLFVVSAEFDESTRVESDTIYLADLQDKYVNLAQKVRRAMCVVAKSFKFDVLLKVDSDSYVFMNTFLSWAEHNTMFAHPSETYYAGHLQANVHPELNKSVKWHDLEYTKRTGRDLYPNYMEGNGYLLSQPLVDYVASTHDADCMASELPDFVSEDVSVGYWIENQSFKTLDMPVASWQVCDDSLPLIADHHVGPSLMLLRRQNFEKYGNPCRDGSDVATSPPEPANRHGMFTKPDGWFQELRALIIGY